LSVETVEGRNVLKITVLEGTIEDVKVTGLTRTKAAVVLRELTVHPGEVFNQPRLRRDLERIFNLNLFEDVQAMPEAGTGPGQVIISVEVKEKKTGLASAGLGWSSVERLVGFVDVAESNFRGTGERVNLRAEFGGTKSWEAGYYNPWIAPKHTALNVAIYDKLTLREAFGEVESVLYYEKRGGGSVTLSRPVRSNTILSGTMRIDNLGVRQYQDQETPPDLSTLSQGRIRSITGMGTSDTRNLIANPSRGWYRSVSLEAAGFGGDSTFQKYGLDVRNYRPIFARRGMVAAARLLLGTASGNPPWLEQYLVGGGQTLRGYKEGRFPGTHMVVLNTELRVPFGKTISGVAFVDVGDAWGGSFAAEFGDAARKWHVGYGLGVRVITPIGPLRLDYGIGSEGAQTHFSVGQVF
jgi:outer membrane protein insertion porin family